MATDDAAMKSMAAQIIGDKSAGSTAEAGKPLTKKEKRALKLAEQREMAAASN